MPEEKYRDDKKVFQYSNTDNGKPFSRCRVFKYAKFNRKAKGDRPVLLFFPIEGVIFKILIPKAVLVCIKILLSCKP
jgi:hypothetical protein